VEFGSGAIDLTHTVSHTGLETHEGSQMTRHGRIILGEGSDATSVMLGALSGIKLQRTQTRMFEFTVRHL
jgi:hypothetical protein